MRTASLALPLLSLFSLIATAKPAASVPAPDDPPPPPSSFTVGGTLSGATGAVTLQNNGANDLRVNNNGAFTFPAQPSNSAYSITVKTQPTGQTCTVAHGSGILLEPVDITDVAVSCTTTASHTLSGTVTGLNNNGVVLQNNGGNDQAVNSASPVFSFGSLAVGSSYRITVRTHPSFPAANCNVTGGSGIVADSDIIVRVNCIALPVPLVHADIDAFDTGAIKLSWPNLAGTGHYDLLLSTDRNCDFRRNPATCGEVLINVGTIVSLSALAEVRRFRGQQLEYNRPYYMQLVTSYPNGAQGVAVPVSARPNKVAFDGSVKAIAPGANGTVYLGGSFTHAGVANGGAAPLDPFTGRLATGDFPLVTGTVRAIVGDGVGGWFIGGKFTHVGGVAHQNLAHIAADGTVNDGFNRDPDGPSGEVRALARVAGTLYIAGQFSTVTFAGSNFSRANVAAFTTGGQLLSWNPTLDGAANALAVMGHALYVGGEFDGGGIPHRLAAFNIDSNGVPISVSATSFDMGLNAAVDALAVSGTSTLYVGGRFTSPRIRAARIDLNAGVPTVSTLFRPDPEAGVSAIAVSNDSTTVYLGGSFPGLRAGSVLRSRLAAVSADDGTTLPWAPEPDGVVLALAVAADGTVYVGGRFSSIGRPQRQPRFNLAAIHPLTAGASGFQPDPVGAVFAIRRSDRNDTIYAGGDFRFFGRIDRQALAALDATGSLLPWNPAAAGQVLALVYHANKYRGNVLYVGGAFSSINGTAKRNLAAVRADTGALLSSDEFDGVTNGFVSALSLADPGDANMEALYVGGTFSTVGSTDQAVHPANNLAKLFYFNGTIDLNFRPEPNGPVMALAAIRESIGDVVYVGGAFDSIRRPANGRAHANLAKVDGDFGIALNAFDSVPTGIAGSINLDGGVTALAVWRNAFTADSVVYVGGRFDRINSPRGNVLVGPPGVAGIAALGANGEIFTDPGVCANCFNPAPDGGVPQVLAVSGNTVYAGGTFPNIGGQPNSNYAVLTAYVPFAPTGNSFGFAFPNGPVFAIVRAGNKVYVGGNFSGFGGSARGGFAVTDVTTGAVLQ